MNERLTWSEIMEKYPDQWVGLSEVEWSGGENGGGGVVSAVVSHIGMSGDELFNIQIDTGGSTVGMYTNPLKAVGTGFPVGVIDIDIL